MNAMLKVGLKPFFTNIRFYAVNFWIDNGLLQAIPGFRKCSIR